MIMYQPHFRLSAITIKRQQSGDTANENKINENKINGNKINGNKVNGNKENKENKERQMIRKVII